METKDIQAARQVILVVAKNIFQWERSIEEISCMMAQDGELGDLEDFQSYYNARRGLFLVALDQDKVIGTGAVREFSGDICELKRLWVLEEYHGKGIGYQLTKTLMEFARQRNFKKIRLETSPLQTRAIRFYQNLGFHIVEVTKNQPENYIFELDLI